MKGQFTVSLERIIKEFSLESLHMPCEPGEVLIENTEINRPGLQFCGYYEYYDNKRIQILGKSELSYLRELEKEKYKETVDGFFATKPAAVIITRNIEVDQEFIDAAKVNAVPLLKTGDSTSGFLSALSAC